MTHSRSSPLSTSSSSRVLAALVYPHSSTTNGKSLPHISRFAPYASTSCFTWAAVSLYGKASPDTRKNALSFTYTCGKRAKAMSCFQSSPSVPLQNPKWSISTVVAGHSTHSASMSLMWRPSPLKHMNPTGTPSSPALANMARPASSVMAAPLGHRYGLKRTALNPSSLTSRSSSAAPPPPSVGSARQAPTNRPGYVLMTWETYE
mmetsp:Transcript_5263/g.9141  ORF Transcript_5263/g.9141 Transcript_5263/m.9141 type:complete len:205 (-) Transcript_5263:558-1172(-)